MGRDPARRPISFGKLPNQSHRDVAIIHPTKSCWALTRSIIAGNRAATSTSTTPPPFLPPPLSSRLVVDRIRGYIIYRVKQNLYLWQEPKERLVVGHRQPLQRDHWSVSETPFALGKRGQCSHRQGVQDVCTPSTPNTHTPLPNIPTAIAPKAKKQAADLKADALLWCPSAM